VSSFWSQVGLLRPGWIDLLEIAIVAALFYRILLLIQRTRAMQMLLGVLLLVGGYSLARLLDLVLIRTLLETVFQYGAIAALVVFQPELRSALARLGQSRLMVRLFHRMEESHVVEEIVSGVEQLARTRTGAILAIEQQVGLDEYAATGSALGARVSAQILTTIFTPYSPLHDGAVIIAGDEIRAAGAILPLTQSQIQDRSLGTRHRAALGLSEETDALVVVVSEETARISVARRGRLESGIDGARLREILEAALPRSDGALAAVFGFASPPAAGGSGAGHPTPPAGAPGASAQP
jgi:diadenylate cyclase